MFICVCVRVYLCMSVCRCEYVGVCVCTRTHMGAIRPPAHAGCGPGSGVLQNLHGRSEQRGTGKPEAWVRGVGPTCLDPGLVLGVGR